MKAYRLQNWVPTYYLRYKSEDVLWILFYKARFKFSFYQLYIRWMLCFRHTYLEGNLFFVKYKLPHGISKSYVCRILLKLQDLNHGFFLKPNVKLKYNSIQIPPKLSESHKPNRVLKKTFGQQNWTDNSKQLHTKPTSKDTDVTW